MTIRSTSIKLITAACLLAAILGVGWVAAAENQRNASLENSRTPLLPGAALAAGKEQTDLDIFALNGTKGIQSGPVGSNDWELRMPGYNIIRSFNNHAGQKILFLLNGNTGEAQTFELNANGNVGKGLWWTALNPLPELRCTAAEMVKLGDQTKLITQDSFTGKIHAFVMNEDGSPSLPSMTVKTLPDMQDKNLFRIYYHSFYGYQMIGVDTWTGAVAVYWLDMQKTAGKTWTRGWTSLDNLYLGGVTYRLLYKAAGDPHAQPGENTNQVGRFLIESVAPNGVDAQTIQDTKVGEEYSTVRFIKIPVETRGSSGYGVLFYRRTNGDYALYEFNPQIGLGKLIDQGVLRDNTLATPPYIDLEPCVVNGQTYLAFVNADNASPVGFAQANQMAQTIYDNMSDKTVGYQFMLAQSGRIIHRRAWGKAKLDHDPAQETDMTTHTQLNIGSVSKMVTALTVLKLVEQGQIDLDAPISDYLVDEPDAGSWATKTPVFNLLTHTSGVSGDKCSAAYPALTVECKDFFNAKPDLKCGVGGYGQVNCERSYNNSNLIAARKVIEKVTNVQDSPGITQKTHELWAESVDLDKMTCQISPTAYYFGPCVGKDGYRAADCFLYEGKYWRREHPTDYWSWSEYCSSGGWYASARELMAFLGAIRYGKIFKNQILTNVLLSTNWADLSGVPGSTAFSWEAPVKVNGEPELSKGGYLPWNGVAAKAYVTRLPHNCDAVIQVNTEETSVYIPGMVNDAYSTAVPK